MGLLTCGGAVKIITPSLRDHCHRAASGGIRLHIREDPALSVLAGGGVFRHFLGSAPGRIRTCAHGSGGRCSIP